MDSISPSICAYFYRAPALLGACKIAQTGCHVCSIADGCIFYSVFTSDIPENHITGIDANNNTKPRVLLDVRILYAFYHLVRTLHCSVLICKQRYDGIPYKLVYITFEVFDFQCLYMQDVVEDFNDFYG